jgi:hypothetical protein
MRFSIVMRSNRIDRASVLVCVLVCMGVASVISLGALKSSLTHRRELQRHWQMEQTQWVLEAGWQRGRKAKLADDRYTGEVWQMEGVLQSDLDCTVEIKIEPQDTADDFEQLVVIATLQTRTPVPMVTRRSQSWPWKKNNTENDSLQTEDSQ